MWASCPNQRAWPSLPGSLYSNSTAKVFIAGALDKAIGGRTPWLGRSVIEVATVLPFLHHRHGNQQTPPLSTMPSADFCAPIKRLSTLSVLSDTAQTSRGKSDRLPRITVRFTADVLDGYGLRGSGHARPAQNASCPVPVRQSAPLFPSEAVTNSVETFDGGSVHQLSHLCLVVAGDQVVEFGLEHPEL